MLKKRLLRRTVSGRQAIDRSPLNQRHLNRYPTLYVSLPSSSFAIGFDPQTSAGKKIQQRGHSIKTFGRFQWIHDTLFTLSIFRHPNPFGSCHVIILRYKYPFQCISLKKCYIFTYSLPLMFDRQSQSITNPHNFSQIPSLSEPFLDFREIVHPLRGTKIA